MTEIVLYRHDHADGTSKDWAYPLNVSSTDPGLTVFDGRTGSPLRQSVTPAATCRQGNPLAEVSVRVGEKIDQGYRLIGEYRLAANCRHMTPLAVEEVMIIEPEPARWHWRPITAVGRRRRRGDDE